MEVGDEVALLLWDDTSGIVLGPYENNWDWPVQGNDNEQTAHDFTAQGYTTYPNLGFSLTIKQTSYFWVAASFTARPNTATSYSFVWRIQIDGESAGNDHRQGCPVANYYTTQAAAHRTTGAYSPGTYAFTIGLYVVVAGHTVECRHATLSAWAMPA